MAQVGARSHVWRASRAMRAAYALAVVAAVAVVVSHVGSAAAFTMVVAANTEQCFFEDLEENGKLQGSFEVLAGGFLDLDCSVHGPGGSVHYTVQREKEGRFLMLAPSKGTYKVCFGNKMPSAADKTVSFALHQGDSQLSQQLAKKGACCGALQRRQGECATGTTQCACLLPWSVSCGHRTRDTARGRHQRVERWRDDAAGRAALHACAGAGSP